MHVALWQDLVEVAFPDEEDAMRARLDRILKTGKWNQSNCLCTRAEMYILKAVFQESKQQIPEELKKRACSILDPKRVIVLQEKPIRGRLNDNTPIVAFKGTDQDMGSMSVECFFQVGPTFTLPDRQQLILGQQGYHCCRTTMDVFRWYPPFKKCRLFKVAIWGEIHYGAFVDKEGCVYEKFVARNIRFIKELPILQTDGQFETSFGDVTYAQGQETSLSVVTD